MYQEIVCSGSKCRNKILRKGSDGNWRFSIKTIKLEDEDSPAVAICKSCGRENELPFSFTSVVPDEVESPEEGSKEIEKSVPKRRVVDFSPRPRGFAIQRKAAKSG